MEIKNRAGEIYQTNLHIPAIEFYEDLYKERPTDLAKQQVLLQTIETKDLPELNTEITPLEIKWQQMALAEIADLLGIKLEHTVETFQYKQLESKEAKLVSTPSGLRN